MKTLIKRGAALLAGISMLGSLHTAAAPIRGKEFTLKQPDGSHVKVKVWGDEFYQRVESIDGYTLVRDEKGWIRYAALSADSNALLPTGNIYQGKSTQVAQLAKHLELRAEAIRRLTEANRTKLKGTASGKQLRTEDASAAPTIGAVKGITVLVDFSDEPATIPASEIEKLFNQVGYTGYGNNGSVRDYYRAMSDNKLDYTNVVKGYYRAKKPKTYYDQPEKYGQDGELLGEILEWLNNVQNLDFSTLSTSNGYLRALNVMYAGHPDHGWSKGLWPHQSWNSNFTYDGVTTNAYQITNIGQDIEIGVICHETGHMLLDWPDLYDTQAPGSSGLGGFCLMSWQGDNKNPVPPCAYLRWKAGWANTVEINDVQGWYDLPANSNTMLKYNHPSNGREYFFLESRQKQGRNQALPDDGLMIWHVDEYGWNSYEQMTADYHYKVSLEQADGLFDLEKDFGADEDDLYKAGKVDTFNDQTLPNAKWWAGNPSGLNVSQVSAVGPVMQVYLDNQEPEVIGVCSFGAPSNYPLPSTGYKEYKYAHLIGTEGPDVYNWSQFVIQWDQANKGLYNLYLKTYNHLPSPWVNLIPKSYHSLGQSQPSITFHQTGIPGLDGTYHVALHNGNLVLAEATGKYTIYLSNTGTTPTCPTARSEEVAGLEFSVSPNPVSSIATIVSDKSLEGATLLLSDEFGREVSVPSTSAGNKVTVDVSGLMPGVYIAKLQAGQHVKLKKILVDR